MIHSKKPLSMAETCNLLEEAEETEKIKKLKSFIKKFPKIDAVEARKLKKELQESGILKLNDEMITKIIDMLPEDIEDVRKVIVETSLDENEISKILEIVEKYR